MTRPSTTPRPTWPAVRDSAAFVLGTFILVWQTVGEQKAQDVLVAAGILCLGVTGSSVAKRVLERALGLPAEEDRRE